MTRTTTRRDRPVRGAARGTAYQRRANAALVDWRHLTETLVSVDPSPAPYVRWPDGPALPYCLPGDAGADNLLPGVRSVALERFNRLGIPWHDGTGVARQSPSNHLRDSQVQCVNALMPFVDNPTALNWLFGDLLPIREVLRFGDPQAPDDHVAFEWIGLDDHLGEGEGRPRTRGARTTSADAAIRYRTPDGGVEIALIEWKYTEAYLDAEEDPDKRTTRLRRYGPRWQRAVRTDVVRLEALFIEPVFQLLRLQMLAREMECRQELGADRVRLIWAAPAANDALFASVPRWAGFTDVRDLWQAMQVEPGRFDWLDTARFVEADAPTSTEFKTRYAHLASGAERSLA
jgi:hypothetical protein